MKSALYLALSRHSGASGPAVPAPVAAGLDSRAVIGGRGGAGRCRFGSWLAILAVFGLWLVGLVPVAAAAFPVAADRPALKGPQRADHVTVELVADQRAVRPGEPLRIGLRLRHDAGWHTYWRNPGDSGLPTVFEPRGPAGAAFGAITWPAPERLAIGPLANYGYEGDIVLARDVRMPASIDGPVRFETDAQWLVCREVCIPGDARLALELPVASGGDPVWSDTRRAFDEAAATAPRADAAIGVDAAIVNGQLELALPADLEVARAEFFPYFDAVVLPAADQRLYRRGTGAGQQLAIGIQPDAPMLASIDEAGRAGLLVADGRSIEVRLQPVAALPAAGEPIGVASVRQPSPGSGAPAASTAGSTAATSGAASGGSLLSASRTGPGAPTGAAAESKAAPGTEGVAAGAGSLAVAVGGAVLGGLLLNLMPCVFPVIGLKVLSFANPAEGAAVRRRHAFAFAAGILVSLALLGGLLLGLRAVGQAVGWGFQLQSPLFVASMALLFVLIALNLFGVFEIGARLTTIEAGGSGGWGHFGSGVVAVLVATPCTAPFMGSAIGFTLGAPPIQTLAIFIALGVGMALPYLLFGLVPALLRWLPRPGPWLEGFRQFLGFPMLATAAWLAWVLTLQTGADGGLGLLIASVLVAFVAWLVGRRQRRGGRPTSAVWGAIGAAAMVLGIIGVGSQLALIARLGDEAGANASARADGAGGPGRGVDSATGPAGASGAGAAGAGAARAEADPAIDWRPWSTAAVDAALAEGRPVFVDFTAAWCISCQANKKIALERGSVRRAFAEAGIVALRADWTRGDPAITAELARHGRNGVPLYLYYPPGGAAMPRTLPELLTPEIVVTAISAQLQPQARLPAR